MASCSEVEIMEIDKMKFERFPIEVKVSSEGTIKGIKVPRGTIATGYKEYGDIVKVKIPTRLGLIRYGHYHENFLEEVKKMDKIKDEQKEDPFDSLFFDEMVRIEARKGYDGEKSSYQGAIKFKENKIEIVLNSKQETYYFDIFKEKGRMETWKDNEIWQENQILLYKINKAIKLLSDLKRENPTVDGIIEIREFLRDYEENRYKAGSR